MPVRLCRFWLMAPSSKLHDRWLSFCKRASTTAGSRMLRRLQSSLPEPLGWDAERSVEARGRILPRDDHRQFSDGVVVVVSLQAREELIVDVATRVRHRVGVFERHNLRVTEERALRVVGKRVNLFRRDA